MAAPLATIARPIAPKPRGKSGEEPEPAVPPKPVPGAPTGTTVVGVVVVVVARVVVVTGGAVVVVDEGTVVVVVVTAAAHTGTVMLLPSSVTAPFLASTRPLKVAPVFIVAELRAITVPTM
jgi:hypothetical protein